MAEAPNTQFGKRRPKLPRLTREPVPEPQQARKRSQNVVLLLMGTMVLGGSAYALMPSEKCDPNRIDPATGQPTACRSPSSGTRSGGGGSWGGHRDDNTSQRANLIGDASAGHASGGPSSSGPVTTQRSGFGSFMSHFNAGS